MKGNKEAGNVAKHRQFLRHRRTARSAGMTYPQTRTSGQISGGATPSRPTAGGYKPKAKSATPMESYGKSKSSGGKSPQMLWVEERLRNRKNKRKLRNRK